MSSTRGAKVARIIASTYLFLVLVTTIPLIKDLAIHHGNGLAFLGASILTSPLSWLFFWILDTTTNSNAFYVTGWLYLLNMSVIFACALINAGAILFVASGSVACRVIRRLS